MLNLFLHRILSYCWWNCCRDNSNSYVELAWRLGLCHVVTNQPSFMWSEGTVVLLNLCIILYLLTSYFVTCDNAVLTSPFWPGWSIANPESRYLCEDQTSVKCECKYQPTIVQYHYETAKCNALGYVTSLHRCQYDCSIVHRMKDLHIDWTKAGFCAANF